MKMLGLATVAAMALSAFFAGSASATTLEVTGVTKNAPVTIGASLKPPSHATFAFTSGTVSQTCSMSNVEGTTVPPYSGASVGGPLTKLEFTYCINPFTVHKNGSFSVTHIAGTTNGTVTSSGAEWTWYSSTIGAYINCKTGVGTHLGTLTGSSPDHATLHVNTVLNCGFFLPSAKWEATYTFTSPTGLGVSA